MASPVKPTVGVGPTTVAGGAVTLAAYAVAIVAFTQGARDEQTISALVIGTLSLLTTLGGRYAQAVAAVFVIKRAPTPQPLQPLASTGHVSGSTLSASTWNEPRPGASVTNEVTAETNVEQDEPADPDALPDYETTTIVPPDEGDSAPEASA